MVQITATNVGTRENRIVAHEILGENATLILLLNFVQ